MTELARSEPAGGLSSWGGDGDDDLGFEDVDSTDLAIPRLRIEHADGLFKDSLSGETWPELDVIILGLVKQRIFWRGELEEGERPACKSPNAEYGFPNTDPKSAVDKRFPWEESNYSPEDAQPIVLEPSRQYPDGWSSNGHGVISCSGCVFAEWTKTSSGKNEPPPCNEQHTYPVLYRPVGAPDAAWTTAILTLQRTGIKPSKQYISAFAQSKTPMFSVVTRLRLNRESRGTVRYSVPVFVRGEQSDRENWPEWATLYRTVRSFLRQAPRPVENGAAPEAAPSANVNEPRTKQAQAPARQAQQAQQAPAKQAPAAPPVEDDDDDLPF